MRDCGIDTQTKCYVCNGTGRSPYGRCGYCGGVGHTTMTDHECDIARRAFNAGTEKAAELLETLGTTARAKVTLAAAAGAIRSRLRIK